MPDDVSIHCDDGLGREEGSRLEPRLERTSNSEGRQAALRKRPAGTEPDSGNSRPSLTRGSFLSFERASER